ncbi:hypothetical protein J6590_064249 [Homalodisca vitripennis]|nr:hypothetical protein J6590_064249 [Homalodisca vitripennis]
MAGGTRLVDTQLTNRGVEAGEFPSASACDTRIIALTIQYYRRESTRPRCCLQMANIQKRVEAGSFLQLLRVTRIIALTIQYFRRINTAALLSTMLADQQIVTAVMGLLTTLKG